MVVVRTDLSFYGGDSSDGRMYYGYDWRRWANVRNVLVTGRLVELWRLVRALGCLERNKGAGNGDTAREGAIFGNWLHRKLGVYNNCRIESSQYLTAFSNHPADADSTTAEEIDLIELEL